jgi:hypothetical protein
MAKQSTTANLPKTPKEKKGKYHDFDGHWKGMIEEFIEEFIEFFLPKLYPNVDFTFKPEFLDTELQNILESIGTSKRILDKLVKVRLKDGTFKWLLIHIEVQSYFEKLFAERMFLLYAMIFGKFRQKILGIAIYTGKKIPKNFNKYEDSGYGSTAFYEFIAYIVRDQNEAALLASTNIFALFVLANLYVIKTHQKDPNRLLMKEKLFELAFERKIDLHKITRLLTFVDGLMQLSKDLQMEYKNFVFKQVKTNPKMVKMNESSIMIQEYLAERAEFRRMKKQEFEERLKMAESPIEVILDEYKALTAGYVEIVKEQEAKVEEQEAKVKEQEAKVKEQEAKVKEQEAKQRTAIFNLYFTNAWTVEQIAELFKLEKEEVQAILDSFEDNE